MIEIAQADVIEAITARQKSSIDTVWIDPPYNTGLKESKVPQYHTQGFAEKNWENFKAEWDTIEDYYGWTYEYLKALRPKMKKRSSIWIAGTYHNLPDVGRALRDTGWWTMGWVAWCVPNAFPNLSGRGMASSVQLLVWARPYDKNFYNYEAAKTYNDGKNLRTYWLLDADEDVQGETVPWILPNDTAVGRHFKHPSKKPPKLVARSLHISTPQDGVVVDFFGGSGTTGVAVQNLNKEHNMNLSCYLSDREADYVAMMHRRLV